MIFNAQLPEIDSAVRQCEQLLKELNEHEDTVAESCSLRKVLVYLRYLREAIPTLDTPLSHRGDMYLIAKDGDVLIFAARADLGGYCVHKALEFNGHWYDQETQQELAPEVEQQLAKWQRELAYRGW